MNGAIDSPALAAIAKPEACGKRGPRTGAFCRRFKGHEQPPSPLLGADFHEAGDHLGVIERWPVTEEEVAAKEQAIIGGLAAGGKHGTMRAALATELDSVEGEIAAAEAWEDLAIKAPFGKFRDRLVDEAGYDVRDPDPGPEPQPATKEAELDQVNELLSAAGFLVADQFQRAGAPGSGVFYGELNQGPGSAPVIVRVQMLFGRPVSWGVVGSWITDLDSLREALR